MEVIIETAAELTDGALALIPLVRAAIILDPVVIMLVVAPENASTTAETFTVASSFIADLNEPTPLVSKPERLDINTLSLLADVMEEETLAESNPEILPL